MPKHERFHRNVWAFKDDLTGSLAKWLIHQSPYDVPANLSICVRCFHAKISKAFDWDKSGMCELDLRTLTEKLNPILESIPHIMALNERKNGRNGHGFCSRYTKEPDPDDDFIDIEAVAQNICCDFAQRADAEAWLDSRDAQKAEPIEPNEEPRV